MRGLTINDSVVILDEAQNASVGQIKTFVTRLGMRSKFIICGDIDQSDIKGLNGLKDSLNRFPGITGVDFSDFNLNDVVRHPIVAEMLKRYEKN
jgi:phosphate starvation-inducible PhoH-like protein